MSNNNRFSQLQDDFEDSDEDEIEDLDEDVAYGESESEYDDDDDEIEDYEEEEDDDDDDAVMMLNPFQALQMAAQTGMPPQMFGVDNDGSIAASFEAMRAAMAQHAETSGMQQLFRTFDDFAEQQRQEEEALRASQVKCPLCTTIHQPTEPAEVASVGSHYLVSHDARPAFLENHTCAVCWEAPTKDQQPMISLACGHVVCRGDFQSLGGSVVKTEHPSDRTADATRAPAQSTNTRVDNGISDAGVNGSPSPQINPNGAMSSTSGSPVQARGGGGRNRNRNNRNRGTGGQQGRGGNSRNEVQRGNNGGGRRNNARGGGAGPASAANGDSDDSDSDGPPPLVPRNVVGRAASDSSSDDDDDSDDGPPGLILRGGGNNLDSSSSDDGSLPPLVEREQRQGDDSSSSDDSGPPGLIPRNGPQGLDSSDDESLPPLAGGRRTAQTMNRQEDDNPPDLMHRAGGANPDSSSDDDDSDSIPELVDRGAVGAEDSSDSEMEELRSNNNNNTGRHDRGPPPPQRRQPRAEVRPPAPAPPPQRRQPRAEVRPPAPAPPPPPPDPFADMPPLCEFEDLLPIPHRGTWVLTKEEDTDEGENSDDEPQRQELAFVYRPKDDPKLKSIKRGKFPSTSQLIPGGPAGSVWVLHWSAERPNEEWTLTQIWADSGVQLDLYRIPPQSKLMGDGIGGVFALVPNVSNHRMSSLIRLDCEYPEGQDIRPNVPRNSRMYRGDARDDSVWLHVPETESPDSQQGSTPVLLQDDSEVLGAGVWHFTSETSKHVANNLPSNAKLSSSPTGGGVWIALPLEDDESKTKVLYYTPSDTLGHPTQQHTLDQCSFSDVETILGYHHRRTNIASRTREGQEDFLLHCCRNRRWKLCQGLSLKELCDCPRRSRIGVSVGGDSLTPWNDIYIWKKVGRTVRRNVLQVDVKKRQTWELENPFSGGTMIIPDSAEHGST